MGLNPGYLLKSFLLYYNHLVHQGAVLYRDRPQFKWEKAAEQKNAGGKSKEGNSARHHGEM